MNTKTGLLIAAVVLSLLFGWTIYAQKQNSTKVLWEYSVIFSYNNALLPRMLNELGNQGWELVSVTETPTTDGRTATVYLKRRR
jgi:hypothetical protein